MSEMASGDVVQLKSGGPCMTVDDIGDYSPMGVGGEPMKAKCSWFDGNNKRTDVFPLHTLQKVQKVQPARLQIRRG